MLKHQYLKRNYFEVYIIIYAIKFKKFTARYKVIKTSSVVAAHPLSILINIVQSGTRKVEVGLASLKFLLPSRTVTFFRRSCCCPSSYEFSTTPNCICSSNMKQLLPCYLMQQWLVLNAVLHPVGYQNL
jgi:hypothetical protein